MITTQVTFSDFWSWLQKSDSYKSSFSYEGAKALFEYLDETSDSWEDGGDKDNFDPIAWCCEFREYESFEELQGDYEDVKSMDDLQERTVVVNESPLVIASF